MPLFLRDAPRTLSQALGRADTAPGESQVGATPSRVFYGAVGLMEGKENSRHISLGQHRQPPASVLFPVFSLLSRTYSPCVSRAIPNPRRPELMEPSFPLGPARSGLELGVAQGQPQPGKQAGTPPPQTRPCTRAPGACTPRLDQDTWKSEPGTQTWG